jgi:sugar phosphate isomerase/epimerase
MPNHVIVSTLGWGGKTLEAAMAGVAALEMSQVELAVFQAYGDIRPKALADGGRAGVVNAGACVRELMAEYGVKQVSTMYTGAGDAGLPLTEELRRMSAVADLAVELGVPLVTVLGSASGTKFASAFDRLKAIREIHAARGLITSMKTHRGLVGEMPGDAVRLCEAVPDLGLTLEASHYLVGANQGEPFWQVLPHVRHVTLRDARIIPVALQMAPGYGDVDFGQIITRLHDHGYEGKFAVEYVDLRPVDGPVGVARDIPSCIAAMRNLFLSLEKQLGVR